MSPYHEGDPLLDTETKEAAPLTTELCPFCTSKDIFWSMSQEAHRCHNCECAFVEPYIETELQEKKMNKELRKEIDIVFDGPPGPEGGRFVEVEDDSKSVSIGRWIRRDDGYWVLRISVIGYELEWVVIPLGSPRTPEEEEG